MILQGRLQLHVLDEKYPQTLLTRLRDETTPPRIFRETLRRFGEYSAIKIMEILDYSRRRIRTPTGSIIEGIYLSNPHNILLIGVLRAALPMLEGFLEVYRDAKVGFISARRVEEKGMKPGYEFDIEITYKNIPRISQKDSIIIIDPMIATGSTMERILPLIINESNASRYIISSVISAKEALRKIEKLTGIYNVKIHLYTGSVDPSLNNNGYIIPGLGDAGDRAFNTIEE